MFHPGHCVCPLNRSINETIIPPSVKFVPPETKEFNEVMRDVTKRMGVSAERVERAELMSIGQRKRIENEARDRERRMCSLRWSIEEARSELGRQRAQYESLQRILSSQERQMESLKQF